jgi:hypothetical protein
LAEPDTSIAIAWQVHQHGADVIRARLVVAVLPDVGAADGEIVDVLGASGRLGGEGQALLVAQHVDGAGLAGIGTSGEGDLHAGLGQVPQVIDGGEETGLPKLRHGGEIRKRREKRGEAIVQWPETQRLVDAGQVKNMAAIGDRSNDGHLV